MATTRKIEIFSAGWPACAAAVDRIQERACPSCEIAVLDMRDARVARRARDLGVRAVPAVAIDGGLAGCYAGAGPDLTVLDSACLGRPLS